MSEISDMVVAHSHSDRILTPGPTTELTNNIMVSILQLQYTILILSFR